LNYQKIQIHTCT